MIASPRLVIGWMPSQMVLPGNVLNYLGKITEGSVVCFPERSSLPTGRAFKKNIPPFSFFDVALTFACFPPLLST